METTSETRGSPRIRAAGIGWPLFGSAAGHLVLLTGFLLGRFAAGPNLPSVIQVALVEGFSGDLDVGAGPVIDAERGARRVRGTETNAVTVPPPFPAAVSADGSSAAQPAAGEVPSTAAEGFIPPQDGSAGKVEATLSDKDRSFEVGASMAEGRVTPAGIPGGVTPFRKNTGVLSHIGPEGGVARGHEGRETGLLRERIQSRIVYPEEAVRRGQEGEVLLRIRVGEGGIPKEIRVARSSGAKALDEAARRGVVRAAPLPSRSGWFEVPVRFSLRETRFTPSEERR